MEIKAENIANPPEKMRLMYEAVSELIKEKRELTNIKVVDITSKAGIGKGTAYEYFSSKEELVAHALIYEYSSKIQMLAQVAFTPNDFKDRVYRIMDWIVENKEYNQMYSNLFKVITASAEAVDRKETKATNGMAKTECLEDINPDTFFYQAHAYIYGMIDQFMEEGFLQKAFTERDKGKRSLALLSAMVEYAFVIMGPLENRYISLGENELRAFIYHSLIASLS